MISKSKLLVCLLLAIMLMPSASAQFSRGSDAGGAGASSGAFERVHAEWIIPLAVDLGGLGGSLFSSNWRVTLDYVPLLPDSDEVDDEATFSTQAAINVVGPGDSLVDASYDLVVIYSDCLEATEVQNVQRLGASSSSGSWTYNLSHNGTQPDWEKCLTVFQVTGFDGADEQFTIDIPVTIQNTELVDADAFAATFWVIFVLQILILVLAVWWDLPWVAAFSIPALLAHVFFPGELLEFSAWVFWVILSFGVEVALFRENDTFE